MQHSKPSFLRHSGLVDPTALQKTLTIIGCGAVGSYCALQAARMGWTDFQLWDADIVEDFNLPNQAYQPVHIGKPKVEALADVLKTFNPTIRTAEYNQFFDSSIHTSLLDGPLIIATDSIKSRRDISKAVNFNYKVPIVVEARLAFDYAEIHCVNPLDLDHLNRFDETLEKSDEDIPDGPCNLRICPTLVGVVSNIMIHYLTIAFASKGQVPFEQKFVMKDTLHMMTSK